MLEQLGVPGPPADAACGFSPGNLVGQIERTDRSAGRWRNLNQHRPTPYEFWYREGRAAMLPSDRIGGSVDWNDPPLTGEGMFRLVLDQSGRLKRFERVPPYRQPTPVAPDSVAAIADWGPFFRLAELAPATFQETEPIWGPGLVTDERRAWEGFYPGSSPLPVRIEAGALHGQPVFFCLIDTGFREWILAQPSDSQPARRTPGGLLPAIRNTLVAVSVLVGLFGPALLAWKNLRARRADPRSAFRYGFAVFLLAFG